MSKKKWSHFCFMLKICFPVSFHTIYKALLNEIFCSRETCIDLCENKQAVPYL